LLGGNKLIARLRAEVFDVVDEEGVGEGMLRKEYDLSAAGCETFYYFSADT
jgi:hypothetical protein